MPTHRRIVVILITAAVGVLASAASVLACAGLVTPGGNVRLLRTATLAGWYQGYEHYVTSFVFEGGGAEVGSIVPLPEVPSKVERGGDWTLQRLERETQPKRQAARSTFDGPNAAVGESERAEVVYETRIDALDITILKGGARAVGEWAKEHGFSLTPDAPETLEYYAAQSPVFMAARFNTEAAQDRSQSVGEGTPIHLTIPLENPWVPLRILALGREASEFIDADVYLLTPHRPDLDPAPGDGLLLNYDKPASKALLDDLRSDKGMEWVPEKMWLTYLRVAEEAGDLRYDLAIDATRKGTVKRVVTDGESAQNPQRPATPRQPGDPVFADVASASPVPLAAALGGAGLGAGVAAAGRRLRRGSR